MLISKYFQKKARITNQMNSLAKIRDNVKEVIEVHKEAKIKLYDKFNGINVEYKLLVYNKEGNILFRSLKIDEDSYLWLISKFGKEIYLDEEDFKIFDELINNRILKLKNRIIDLKSEAKLNIL